VELRYEMEQELIRCERVELIYLYQDRNQRFISLNGGEMLDYLTSQYVLIALMMEVVSTSETSVSSRKTVRYNIPQDSHIHTRSLENRNLVLDSVSPPRSKSLRIWLCNLVNM
jgi:hypothetical protein